MGTGGVSLAQRVLEAQRRMGAAYQREVLDEALERRFGHCVGARIVTARRRERTLADKNEGVRLQAQGVRALRVTVFQQAGIAHMITNAFAQIADVHAANQRQPCQQQNQATHFSSRGRRRKTGE
ncbi:hypothetical protein D9M71_334890 [compost metagenome]